MSALAGSIRWAQRGQPARTWWFAGSVYGPCADDDGAHMHALIARDGMSAALKGVEGDFAVAMFDAASRTLQLGRDYFGLQPLYYLRTKAGVVFSSRVGLLLGLADVRAEPRAAWVARYAASHYRTFDDEEALTPFEGVMQVPAGCVVTLDVHGARTERYWSLSEQGDLGVDEAALADRLRELLRASVARRVARCAKPFFTLSGGMDSSSVLFTAARVMATAPVACSAVYEHGEYDESKEIRESLAGAGMDWQPIEVSNELDVELLAEAIRAHEEPIVTSTWLAHYQLCKAVSSLGAKELFDGLGGDELNAGEYEYFPFFFADLRAGGSEALEEEIARWAQLHDHPIHRKDHDVAMAMMEALTDGAVPGRVRPSLARTLRYIDVLADGGALLRSFAPTLVHPFASALKNRTFQDLTRETMPCCLRASERNTSAFGMSSRSPFLDRELVEFMFQIPGTMKIRSGVTKHLLREAMRGVLPEVTRKRTKKVGWNAPSDQWFVGAGAGMMRDLVSSQRFRERGIYRTDRLLALIDEHEAIVSSGAARENHMMVLWQTLNLELWLREVEGWQHGRAWEAASGRGHADGLMMGLPSMMPSQIASIAGSLPGRRSRACSI